MTVTALEILRSDGEKHPTFPLDVEWDTGLAIYCRRRWPVGTRKAVQREWGLSVDDARSVVEGSASKRILSKIWKHPRGGWPVALPIMGAVIGIPIHDFFRQQTLQAAKAAHHAQEHERLAQAAYRRLEDHSAGSRQDRGQGGGPGAVGAEAPRRLAGRT